MGDLESRSYDQLLTWGRDLRGAAAAAAVDLEPVAFDGELRALGELAHQLGHVAGGEVLHRPALGADQVMLMAAAAPAIAQVAVVEQHAAEHAHIDQQLEVAEDG